jgi:ATP-independent RNA helicase DbpA
LDEFDKSLEFGFTRDMSSIVKALSHLKRKILTSATDINEYPNFVRIKAPFELNYLEEEDLKPTGLKLAKVLVENEDKIGSLYKLLCFLSPQPTLVFFNHRDGVSKISDLLNEKGIQHGVFQGGMEQDDREESLIKFRNGSHTILLCTDLASRGLDIPEIQNIIHYQLPHTEDAFTHRNGRTARMKAEGTAYLLMKTTDRIPEFVKDELKIISLPASVPAPSFAIWTTLCFPYGRKEKVNKIDIAGLLYQKGKLGKNELGTIEVTDHNSYAAVKSDKIDEVISLLANEKIKNKMVKLQIV